MQTSDRTPWAWVPSLYFAEGLPYFIVNTISVVMFKDMGMDNGILALVTSLIGLPWVLKPLWSPFVDILKSKRWWIVATQAAIGIALALIALQAGAFAFALTMFAVAALSSATHDISADGYYMLALSKSNQSAFVGIRNTFYRVAMVFGQGVLIVFAGLIQKRSGSVNTAWSVTMLLAAAIMSVLALYHYRILPQPSEDSNRSAGSASAVLKEFAGVFKSFFTKKGVWLAVAFMLLYRLPEALSVKMLYPFFSDVAESGGLGLDKEAYGLVYGTFGVIALLAGGILGGLHIARKGLRHCMLPMALALALPCSVYLLLSIFRPSMLWLVGLCVVFDQFGYGYGFTAYTVYMMRFSDGPLKTSHYALCTGFMALSMLLPGLFAGYLQQWLGYRMFFIFVMICCLATIFVTLSARRRLPSA